MEKCYLETYTSRLSYFNTLLNRQSAIIKMLTDFMTVVLRSDSQLFRVRLFTSLILEEVAAPSLRLSLQLCYCLDSCAVVQVTEV